MYHADRFVYLAFFSVINCQIWHHASASGSANDGSVSTENLICLPSKTLPSKALKKLSASRNSI